MNFHKVREKAKSKWEAIQTSSKPRVSVGMGTCGRAAGAEDVLNTLNEELNQQNIDALIFQVGCIGLCYAEPLIEVAKPGSPSIFYGNVTPEIIRELIRDYIRGDNPRPDLALGRRGEGTIEGIPWLWDLPMLKSQVRISLRNCGNIDPEDIDQYIANDGFKGLEKALEMQPQEVIEEVRKSGLRGRGGAGFPTGVKWQFCHDAAGDNKFIICNADEGDPGAFMDRDLLEGDPFSVLEGMLIGAYAMGASEGYIYIRAEYPLAIRRLYSAIEQMERYGLLGENILGSKFNFHIKIKEGAGAFVCGEETAMLASIEGRRGMPRPRPPFPAQSGLWEKPTNINNVETWSNVPIILQKGGDWYASYGTEKSKGTKNFSLAGKVNRTGLIEVPMGISLNKIVFEIGGGIPQGKKLKAIQTGGPSGGFIPANLADASVDFESLTELGSIMGSGGMVVIDEDTCIVDTAKFFLSFTQAESCGKCIPCRWGTKQMLDILKDITDGRGRPGDIELLEELAFQVRDSSLCALGQTAPNPVLTSIRYFRDEYEKHIWERRCPALQCQSLVNYFILPDKCAGCMICARNCPAKAIKDGKRMVHVIEQEKCIKCGTCLEVCPPKFGAVIKVSGETIEVPSEPVPIEGSK